MGRMMQARRIRVERDREDGKVMLLFKILSQLPFFFRAQDFIASIKFKTTIF